MRIAFLVKNFADGDDLSEYVKSLAEYAADQGNDPCVVSFDDGSHYTVSDDVEVERFELHFDGDSLYTWAMMMNNEMKARVMDKVEDEDFDLIHANDWTTAPGGVTLSKHLEIPMFLTVHSTENQRGFQGENSGLISELEWQGSFEAEMVFANNDDVKNSLLFDLDLSDEKVCVADPLHDGWQEIILNSYQEILGKEVGSLRPLFVTWEYPPYKAGGIAAHCEDLAKTMADQGHEPVVLTYGEEEEVEYRDGVEIHRVPSTDSANNTLSWAMHLGHQMEKKAINLSKTNDFDLVHAHDWMAVPGATGIHKTLGLPMVFTVHSTQKGRDGIEGEYQETIHNLEWYGTYEAEEVITVGREFSEEVKHNYNVPEEKVNYIPNGVNLEKFDNHTNQLNYHDYALDWENIVLFVGRMYPQKGPGHLIEAMPKILNQKPEAKFVMCGSGATEHYKGIAKETVGDKVHFPGYVSEKKLISLMKSAEMTVAPSVYEPFGIVPLEAAACQTATVGSYTGGMKDTIIHEYTGLHTYPADSDSIKDQVTRALEDPGWTDWMGDKARQRVEDNFRWEQISAWTTGIYSEALE